MKNARALGFATSATYTTRRGTILVTSDPSFLFKKLKRSA
jgi:hypothetical protein